MYHNGHLLRPVRHFREAGRGRTERGPPRRPQNHESTLRREGHRRRRRREAGGRQAAVQAAEVPGDPHRGEGPRAVRVRKDEHLPHRHGAVRVAHPRRGAEEIHPFLLIYCLQPDQNPSLDSGLSALPRDSTSRHKT